MLITFSVSHKQIRGGFQISALILEALTLLSMNLIAFIQILPLLGAGSI